MAEIPKSDQSPNEVGITTQRNNGLTRKPGYTEGGIMCLRGVSI
jgi:hypothetical protein